MIMTETLVARIYQLFNSNQMMTGHKNNILKRTFLPHTELGNPFSSLWLYLAGPKTP